MAISDLPARAYEPVLHWAREAPEQTAFEEVGSDRVSYSELSAAISASVDTLVDRGVRPGDRIMIVAENSISTVVLMFAAQRIDAWPAIVNARVSECEISAMKQSLGARLIAYIIENSHAALNHTAATDTEILDLPTGKVAFGATDAAAVPERVHPENDRQVGLLLFTSGTTGQPKVVMLSHRALLNMGSSTSTARRIGPEDRLYGLAPLSHIMGVAMYIMTSVWAGATTRLVPRLDLEDLEGALKRGEITVLMGVPTLFTRLLDYLQQRDRNLTGHRLRNLITGGAPLDPSLKARVEQLFGMPLCNGFAMTECTPILRTELGTNAASESVGIPQGGIEIKIVAKNRDVTDGEVGELWVRGPSLMMGYYRNPEATASVFRPDGWFVTGDLAIRLPCGNYAIVGRTKEIIIRSGFNVYPGEVETAIASHPGVAQCAVIGRPVRGSDEEIIAFVQPLPGWKMSDADIGEHVTPLLSPYKRPNKVVLVAALPVGPTGKIWKSQLTKMT